ncbi:hypothetical protein ABD91_00595 [Lysinibacillus sphaericus]|uniref:hypothetical protein n=1 Tax=Lysinibacillus sphaericus TaxID=1421 RepID=UPI0018CF1178|nr:hypothetical protein [Lysinibacillus sphaericus]MBG9689426.1 hypothetical protein [Lysinibacillus sphaericus]
MYKIEVIDELQNSTIYKVLRANSRGDLVLDVKPRKYIEFVSQSYGMDSIMYKNREDTYSWESCYIKSSKGHEMGRVRRVED